jgi:antirestriction protein
MNQKSTTPRIYVASLSDYNAGRLHGRWIDANQSAEQIQDCISQMLAQSKEPHSEEWAIHDYEGFGSLRISESEDLKSIAEVALLLDKHGELFGRLVEHLGGLSELEYAKRHMDEGYYGSFRNLEEYVEQFIDDCYGDAVKGLPDFMRYHIDYARIGNDFEIGGDIFTIQFDGNVHVFSSNF